jgi:two-component system, OmpR family, phosphate regulon sensor histidine kinase PhoR
MPLSTILLALALAAAVLWSWRRERKWRAGTAALARAAGQGSFDPEKLAARFAGLLEAESVLSREEYLRRLFEALLNEIRQGVVIVDDTSRIKFCNRALGHLLHRPEIRRGRTLMEEISDHQITGVVQDAMASQRRTVRQVEHTTISSSGAVGTRHLLVEAAPLPAKAERGAWLMLYDVTEQTMTEQIRKDFVANASHELRTPLTLINGYIETLQSGVIKDEAARRRCLDVMEKHGKRIVRIIEDMLTISRLENGSSSLTIEPFTVRSVVQDAVDHLSQMLEGRDTRIELDFPADGGPLLGDRFYWDQVFTNLLENAIKENPNPGLVIKAGGRWFSDHCILTVSDNGVGIPAHDLPFVFKRFFRGHKHHSPEIKGTGLGLSIVRRTIEAHGGSVELTSTPGVETLFAITLPLVPPGYTPPSAEAPAEAEADTVAPMAA